MAPRCASAIFSEASRERVMHAVDSPLCASSLYVTYPLYDEQHVPASHLDLVDLAMHRDFCPGLMITSQRADEDRNKQR
jgi:hypothetical protein